MLQSQGQRLVVPSLPISGADRVIAAGGAVLLQIVPGVDEIDPPPLVVEELLQRPIPAPVLRGGRGCLEDAGEGVGRPVD